MTRATARATALLYHDVTRPGEEDASGFPGPHSLTYKLTVDGFAAHLDAIAASRADAPFARASLDGGPADAWMMTFDDGGVTALHPTAELLEARGWRGYYFITTGRTDTPGFLSRDGVRELAARGHVVGSHTVTHPLRMGDLTDVELDREWRDSRAALSEVLGAELRVASVPGGLYNARVGASAARAGYRLLFTSEPTTRVGAIDGCTLVGRFSFKRSSRPDDAAHIAGGRSAARLTQWLTWNGKKAVKVVSPAAFRVASAVFRR